MEDREGRPFVGVFFDCCNAYMRIYRSRDGKEYRGHCPRCMRPIVLRVAEHGTDQRIFRAR